jgi:hypothetical protein
MRGNGLMVMAGRAASFFELRLTNATLFVTFGTMPARPAAT